MGKRIESDIPAFKMSDSIYFVGARAVSVHIIKTECGLVMLDTGYPDMYAQIISGIEEMGFDPKDICAIFHSHGHIDHFGCTERFKALSGAKTYISRIDNDIINGKYDLSWAVELGLERLPPFDCDVLVEDGDVFTFGSTVIRCVLTPGHTDGVLSFFINSEVNGEKIIAAMHGGAGVNSMARDFLIRYNLPFTCRDKFRASLHKLSGEHVDLVLGNHPGQNNTMEKREKALRGESLLDRKEWQRFLIEAERSLEEMTEKEQK